MEFEDDALDYHEEAAFAFSAVNMGVVEVDSAFLCFSVYVLSKQLC